MKKQLQQQLKNSVTKIYPHVGKKNYYCFFDFIITITATTARIKIKKYKKEWGRWGYFLVTHLFLSIIMIRGGGCGGDRSN